MDVLKTIWQALAFLASLFLYLSFSIVASDALQSLISHRDRMKEPYSLSPLSVLFRDSQGLITTLNYARVLFLIPALVIAYDRSWGIHPAVGAVTLLTLALLLHLLPAWLSHPSSSPVFRVTTQAISYILYPGFWLLAKLFPEGRQEELHEEEKNRLEGEPQQEESEVFKGDMLQAISMIEETTVREVMTPRVDMVCIASSATGEELHQFFKDYKFSRIPVYKERIDQIVGVVSVMDFVSQPNADSAAGVTTIMRPALFVPETKKVFTLLRDFRESHAQMAIVIDEYGGTSGLVTLEDLLEEIVGEIEDEYDEARFESFREKEGTYIVTGKFPVERLEEIFHVEVSAEDFETISGLIFSILGRIPVVGEIIEFKNLSFEILEADKRRIHRVRIRRSQQKKNAEPL